MKIKSAEILGLAKNEQAMARRKTKEIQTAWDNVSTDMGTPTKAADWQDYKDAFLANLSPRLAGMSVDAKMKIADAYINQAKRLTGMGGSGGPANNAKGRGTPAYRQVSSK